MKERIPDKQEFVMQSIKLIHLGLNVRNLNYCYLHIQANLELEDMSASPDVNIQIKTFLDKIICESMKSHRL